MNRLGRPLENVIIIDNSPSSYLFQPENSFPCTSWYEDRQDRELLDFMPLLERLSTVKDVRDYMKMFVSENKIDFNRANQILHYGISKGLSTP